MTLQVRSLRPQDSQLDGEKQGSRRFATLVGKRGGFCDGCEATKLTKKSIAKNTRVHRDVVTGPFQVIHADTIGKLRRARGGFQYMVTLVS